MMNKKLIALFVAVATISGTFAGWRDENGNYHRGVRPEHVVGDTTRGAGHVAEETSDFALGTVGPLFGGRNVEERRADHERGHAERAREKYNRE
jgi:hypothetical protein